MTEPESSCACGTPLAATGPDAEVGLVGERPLGAAPAGPAEDVAAGEARERVGRRGTGGAAGRGELCRRTEPVVGVQRVGAGVTERLDPAVRAGGGRDEAGDALGAQQLGGHRVAGLAQPLGGVPEPAVVVDRVGEGAFLVRAVVVDEPQGEGALASDREPPPGGPTEGRADGVEAHRLVQRRVVDALVAPRVGHHLAVLLQGVEQPRLLAARAGRGADQHLGAEALVDRRAPRVAAGCARRACCRGPSRAAGSRTGRACPCGRRRRRGAAAAAGSAASACGRCRCCRGSWPASTSGWPRGGTSRTRRGRRGRPSARGPSWCRSALARSRPARCRTASRRRPGRPAG